MDTSARIDQATSVRDVQDGRFPWWGAAGIALVGLGWAANWLLTGARTHLFFAPLWTGFALTVDGVVLRRTGTSIISRSWRRFFTLFLISVPAWWLFELINLRTQNWIYLGRELFSDLEFFLLSTVAFSTVVPAVFEAAELFQSFRWTSRFADGPRIGTSRRTCLTLAAIGLASLLLILIWPAIFYPLVWGIPFFLLEPLNQWRGRTSLFSFLGSGNWVPVVSLALGALLCGLFWEFWNYYSYPKWTYHTPGVNRWHVFEMPALGYIGYLPFGLALYAMASAFSDRDFVDFGRAASAQRLIDADATPPPTVPAR